MEGVSEGEEKQRSILRDIGKIYFISTRWTIGESTFYFIPNFFCFSTTIDFQNFPSLRTQYNFSVSAAKNNFHKIFICIFSFLHFVRSMPVYPVRNASFLMLGIMSNIDHISHSTENLSVKGTC